MHLFRHKLVFVFVTTLLLAPVATVCRAQFEQKSAVDANVLVLTGAKIFPSPEDAAISDGIVLVKEGKIAAVGRRNDIRIPDGAKILPCNGDAVVAGFWNSHVHFTEPKWQHAADLPAPQLTEHLRRMLTAYGFTSVVDTGSIVANTVAIRRRIESGEIAGPRIMTAGIPIYPENGIPYYVTESLPPEIVRQLSAPASSEEAVRAVDADVAAGADFIKVFLVTGVRREGEIALVSMRPDIVKAVTHRAHQLGKKVFAHPSNIEGLELVLNGGVDILAHTIQDATNWTDGVASRLKSANVALIPTLTLFSTQEDFKGVLHEVKSYADTGGDILFGSDAGFLTDYPDLTREYSLLSLAGLTFPQILTTLTTAPAKRLDPAGQGGRIVEGAAADLVVLKGDPSTDVRAFTRVRYTIRAGRLIYASGE